MKTAGKPFFYRHVRIRPVWEWKAIAVRNKYNAGKNKHKKRKNVKF